MKEGGTILIVEDDMDINNLLRRILRREGYHTISAFSGTEAELCFGVHTIDLMLIDLMLPGISGEEVVNSVRNKLKINMPIIVISAKTSLGSKVEVMKNGADDYITKPFEVEEVLVRVMAVLRRYQVSGQENGVEKYTYKNLVLYKDSHMVMVKTQIINVTPHEYELLKILMENLNKVLSRETLYEQVWKGGYYGEDNTVNVHISNIRKKIAQIDSKEEYIKTVWGIGFIME